MRMMPFLMPLIWWLFSIPQSAVEHCHSAPCCEIHFIYMNKSDCGLYDKNGNLVLVLHKCHFERNHD